MTWRAPEILALILLGTLPTAATAADPDAFDPLLDAGPSRLERADRERVERHDPRSPGFTLTGLFGIYAGKVRSFLTKEESGLGSGAQLAVGFGFGYRTRSPVELGLDVSLGFGKTYDKEVDDNIPAYDGLVEPRLYYHFLERAAFGAYAGAIATGALFDLGIDGINQGGVGPGGLLGLQRRLDRHSLIFIEASGIAFHDFLAYHYVDPTQEELAEDPDAKPRQVVGRWYPLFRISAGYRLTAF